MCKSALLILWVAGAAVADSSGPIPIEMVNHYPVIPLVIDGEVIPASFDLGGDNQIELTSEALQRIKAVPLTGSYAWINAKGTRLEARKFRIPELRIGNSVFHNVEGHEDVDDPSYPKTRAGLGRVGRGLLQAYQVILDYPHQRMTFVSGPHSGGNECSGHRIPFDPEWQGWPVSAVDSEFGRLIFVWDTGAPANFIQTRLAESSQVTSPFKLQKFSMAGHDYGPMPMAFVTFSEPKGVDGFIGTTFFSRHIVCVDMPNKSFHVTAAYSGEVPGS